MRAQAKATANIAAASAEKTAVMQDQAALNLFSIPNDLILNEMAREYVQLWREEELAKIERRMEIAKEATLSKEATSKENSLVAASLERTATPMFDFGSRQSVAPLNNKTSPAIPYRFFLSNSWGSVGFETDGDPTM